MEKISFLQPSAKLPLFSFARGEEGDASKEGKVCLDGKRGGGGGIRKFRKCAFLTRGEGMKKERKNGGRGGADR